MNTRGFEMVPSLPFISPSLSLKSQPRSRACASFYSSVLLHLPLLLLGTSTPLKSREPKRREREREREAESLPSQAKVPSPSPPRAQPPSSSHIRLCPALCRSLIQDLAGGGSGSGHRLFFFRAMETRPDSFRPGRWSGFLTGSDSYWFK